MNHYLGYLTNLTPEEEQKGHLVALPSAAMSVTAVRRTKMNEKLIQEIAGQRAASRGLSPLE